MEGTYENGKKQGLSTSWHPNGAKWQHQLHVAGQPKGTWKTWDPKGNLISQIFHKQNADQNVSLGIPN
jgi:antitoxin component YwqK of YwqJK toxin-antitoxin module